jgi:hypothetical protein
MLFISDAKKMSRTTKAKNLVTTTTTRIARTETDRALAFIRRVVPS